MIVRGDRGNNNQTSPVSKFTMVALCLWLWGALRLNYDLIRKI